MKKYPQTGSQPFDWDEETQELQEKYRSMEDEKLVAIVSIDKGEYRPEAIELAKTELATRGISSQEQANKLDEVKKDRKLTELGLSEPCENAQFYNPSIAKLVILSICTFGIYEIYWFYRQWKAIKKQTGKNISPFWRAWFAFFTCPGLFTRVLESAKDKGFEASSTPGGLIASYMGLVVFANITSQIDFGYAWLDLLLWFIGFLTVLPLVSAQRAMHYYNTQIDPQYVPNGKFSVWAIILCFIGGVLLLLSFVGFLVPYLDALIS